MFIWSVLILLYEVSFYFAEKLSETIGINHIITVFVIPIFLVYILYYSQKKHQLCRYGVCFPKNIRRVLSIFIILLIIPAFNVFCSGFTFRLQISWQSIIEVFTILYVVFFEELIFRGTLPSLIEDDFGMSPKFSTLISNAVFAILHAFNHYSENLLLWTQVFLALGVGLCFSVMKDKSRSIFPAIVLHFLINISSFGGKNILPAENFIWIIVAIFCLTYGIYFYFSKEIVK